MEILRWRKVLHLCIQRNVDILKKQGPTWHGFSELYRPALVLRELGNFGTNRHPRL